MTQRELLVSTVKFYTSNNRGYDENTGACVYSRQENSPGCAIGRFLTTDTQKLFDKNGEISISSILENLELRAFLPKWMLEMSPMFLIKIQDLHDACYVWTNEGFNLNYKRRVDYICNEFGLELLTEDEFKHEITI